MSEQLVPFTWTRGRYSVWGYVQNDRYVVTGANYYGALDESSGYADIEAIIADLRRVQQERSVGGERWTRQRT